MPQSGDGLLNFTAIKREDSGWYKCTARHLNKPYSSFGYFLNVRCELDFIYFLRPCSLRVYCVYSPSAHFILSYVEVAGEVFHVHRKRQQSVRRGEYDMSKSDDIVLPSRILL